VRRWLQGRRLNLRRWLNGGLLRGPPARLSSYKRRTAGCWACSGELPQIRQPTHARGANKDLRVGRAKVSLDARAVKPLIARNALQHRVRLVVAAVAAAEAQRAPVVQGRIGIALIRRKAPRGHRCWLCGARLCAWARNCAVATMIPPASEIRHIVAVVAGEHARTANPHKTLASC